MVRVTSIALTLALAACGAEEQPINSASASSSQLFRGGKSEVRFRCGSESLRARLRQGNVMVQTGSGESKVLVPVDDARAQAGQAYGDGQLTLYKLQDPETWMLARSGGSAPAACHPEGRVN